MSFLLTPEERRRFVDYCRREAESLEAMAKQLGSGGGMPAAATEAITRNYRMRAAGYAIVASDLERVEDVSIRGTG